MEWGPGELWGCPMNWVPPNSFHSHQGCCCPPSCSPWPLPGLPPFAHGLHSIIYQSLALTSQCHGNLALFISPLLAVIISQQCHGNRFSMITSHPHPHSHTRPVTSPKHHSDHVSIRRPSPDPPMDLPSRLLGNSKFKDTVPKNSARFQ